MSYDLLLPFDSDEPEFIRGFEAGRIWAQLRLGPDEALEAATVHADNAEMILRLAEATGRHAQSEELGNGWLSVTFTPSEKTDPESAA